MDVLGRAWRCEACHRLWAEQKHPGATHDHVDGIVVCRGEVVEVEVVPYPNHSGAVTRIAALESELGCAIDALEGKPWTGWSTDTARDTLQGGQ